MEASALELALALHETPSLALAARRRPLPPDVFDLIRIAANDRRALTTAAVRSGASPPRVLEAARLYLEHALFHPQADHYRVLGVAPDAGQETLRRHQRWLLRWLHPDRGDDWDSVYASRVMTAFQQLRDPRRRDAYDAGLRDANALQRAQPPAVMRPVWTARKLEAGRPGMRRLMSLAAGVGGLAVALALVLVLARTGSGTGPEPLAAVDARATAEPVGAADADPAGAAVEWALSAPAAAAPVAAAPSPTADPSAPADPGDASGAIDAIDVADTAVATAPDAADPPARADADPVITATPVPADRVATPPEPPPADEADEADAVTVPGEEAVERLMQRFQQAYAAADIEALMGLFASQARHVRGGRAEIREDYVGLFNASRQRQLQLNQLQWRRSATEATGQGPFVAVVTPARGAPVTVHGQMRVAVISEAGEARIQSLWHEESAL